MVSLDSLVTHYYSAPELLTQCHNSETVCLYVYRVCEYVYYSVAPSLHSNSDTRSRLIVTIVSHALRHVVL